MQYLETNFFVYQVARDFYQDLLRDWLLYYSLNKISPYRKSNRNNNMALLKWVGESQREGARVCLKNAAKEHTLRNRKGRRVCCDHIFDINSATTHFAFFVVRALRCKPVLCGSRASQAKDERSQIAVVNNDFAPSTLSGPSAIHCRCVAVVLLPFLIAFVSAALVHSSILAK